MISTAMIAERLGDVSTSLMMASRHVEHIMELQQHLGQMEFPDATAAGTSAESKPLDPDVVKALHSLEARLRVDAIDREAALRDVSALKVLLGVKAPAEERARP